MELASRSIRGISEIGLSYTIRRDIALKAAPSNIMNEALRPAERSRISVESDFTFKTSKMSNPGMNVK